ncbi:hypothetical protein PLESTB_000852000 [Pleodorina starrii]|uniref:Tc1-like transposase DDE domain-containing protein n=1 Tax=Pleodorina starrii TaxID=330485 RepID=A0A9W6F3C7_9CHLO|nr:hypothetical protein PLESTM_001441400 [Pleodorina starrii]GLC54330.1 hypothetical protein PLESTB_000852000 [Pleodorina starrii]
MEGKTHRPYSRDVRERVVDMYFQDEKTMAEISATFHGKPCIKTVSRIISQYMEDGTDGLSLQGQRGRVRPRRKMDDTVKQLLVDVIERLETSRLRDIAAELCCVAGAEPGFYGATDVCRTLSEIGYSRVRVQSRPYEADPVAQQEWVDWCRSSGIAHSDWVFLDEVFVDSQVTNAKYAWVPQGYRSKVRSLTVRGRRYTTIAAMSYKGIIAAWTFEGPADADAFKQFIANHLTDKMKAWPQEHSVLIMDDCRSHDKTWLAEWATFVGCRAHFLPPYSPDLNPMVKVFGIVKQYLRANADDLRQLPGPVAIALALDDASQGQKCANFILNTPGRPYSLVA